MKRAILLFAAAVPLAGLTAETPPMSFDERVTLARSAEEDERFHPYPLRMQREAGRHFARTMRNCWSVSSRQEPKPFVLVAEIQPDGRPSKVAVKPAHAAARCFAAGFSSGRYLRPPDYPGRDGFPVMMRVAGGR